MSKSCLNSEILWPVTLRFPPNLRALHFHFQGYHANSVWLPLLVQEVQHCRKLLVGLQSDTQTRVLCHHLHMGPSLVGVGTQFYGDHIRDAGSCVFLRVYSQGE